jgi:cytochrome c-type biogenesis protein CcmH/NrfG
MVKAKHNPVTLISERNANATLVLQSLHQPRPQLVGQVGQSLRGRVAGQDAPQAAPQSRQRLVLALRQSLADLPGLLTGLLITLARRANQC